MVDLLSVFQLVKSRAAYGSVNKLLEFLNIYFHLVSFSKHLYFPLGIARKFYQHFSGLWEIDSTITQYRMYTV